MGTAASSALRVDESAYGSLEGMGASLMGGGRKLKKKPVLVLDPEELAAAHAAFHEASAEQLGETVERAPRPAMILGLAPMDDDDLGEMGQADDVDEDADTGQLSPDAVLSLTRRKTAPVVDDALDMPLDDTAPQFGEDSGDVIDAGAGEDLSEEQPIERLDTIEDGLDIANRIFPSLSIVSQDEDYGEEDDGDHDSGPDTGPDIGPVTFPAAFRESIVPPPLSTPPRTAALQAGRTAATPPAAPATTNETPDTPATPDEPTTAPASAHEPLDAPQAARPSALDSITKRLGSAVPPQAPVARSEPGTDPASEPASEQPAPQQGEGNANAPRPVRFDELNPEKDYTTPDDDFDLDAWLAEEEAAREDEARAAEASAPVEPDAPVAMPQDVVEAAAPAPRPEPDVEPLALAAEDIAETSPESAERSVTLTEDDVLDGTAFMRDPRSRRSGVQGAQRGRQSALRAKLLREAEEQAAQDAQGTGSGSLFGSLWAKLRAFFAR